MVFSQKNSFWRTVASLKAELAPSQHERNDGPLRTEDDHGSPATHRSAALRGSSCSNARIAERYENGLLGDGLRRQPLAKGMPHLRQLSGRVNKR